MLKITSQSDETRTTFRLEGSLAGPWVEELEGCWRQAAGAKLPVKISLSAVSFIDDSGRKLLAEMYQHGAELVAEGCMNKAIVKEIMRERRDKNHE
jgi:hypothetical protein